MKTREILKIAKAEGISVYRLSGMGIVQYEASTEELRSDCGISVEKLRISNLNIEALATLEEEVLKHEDKRKQSEGKWWTSQLELEIKEFECRKCGAPIEQFARPCVHCGTKTP
jgi:hypothetical protein